MMNASKVNEKYTFRSFAAGIQCVKNNKQPLYNNDIYSFLFELEPR